MKVKFDPNFILTSVATLVVLIALIAILELLFGLTVATIAGTVAGGIVLKLFDRLDYTPTMTLQTPKLPKGVLFSMVVSAFIVIGSTHFSLGLIGYLKIVFGPDFLCNPINFIIASVLDWGSFVVAGLIIGKLYPHRALLLTYIAVAIGIITHFPALYFIESLAALECLFGEDIIEGAVESFQSGAVIGLILRGYVAIVFARQSSRRANKSK